MAVPFFDLARSMPEELRAAVLRRLQTVLEHGQFILGPEVAELEQRLASFVGTKHAIGVSNGSDALVISLRALGIGPGDEVIVPSFTFFATAGAVARTGAAPVFADIDPDTMCLAPEAVASVAGPATKAIVPVHLYGRPAPVAAIRKAAEQAAGHAVAVLEDSAQAIGSCSEEGSCGALGELSAFSCFPTKNLGACGDAGFVTTDDDQLADRVRRLRVHGGSKQYHHEEVGYNFRMDAFQAAALLERLNHLVEWNAARRESAAHYASLFDASGLLDAVTPPRDEPGHTYHQYVVRVAERDAVRERLTAAEVGCNVYYPVPLHAQPCFAGARVGDMTETERACSEVLALPIFPGLTAAERDEVVQAF